MTPSESSYRSLGEGSCGPFQAFFNPSGLAFHTGGSGGPLQHQHFFQVVAYPLPGLDKPYHCCNSRALNIIKGGWLGRPGWDDTGVPRPFRKAANQSGRQSSSETFAEVSFWNRFQSHFTTFPGPMTVDFHFYGET